MELEIYRFRLIQKTYFAVLFKLFILLSEDSCLLDGLQREDKTKMHPKSELQHVAYSLLPETDATRHVVLGTCTSTRVVLEYKLAHLKFLTILLTTNMNKKY